MVSTDHGQSLPTPFLRHSRSWVLAIHLFKSWYKMGLRENGFIGLSRKRQRPDNGVDKTLKAAALDEKT